MSKPIFITRDGHRTWLKWHRARRRASDPVFTGARIREGLALGASVEIDLMVHKGHGMVVLHGPNLEHETTGSGLPEDKIADELRQFFILDNDRSPTAEPVMLLEDLVRQLTSTGIHSDGLLQLDFKQDATALDPETIRNFKAAVSPVQKHLILSAGDAVAVTELTRDLSFIRIGYDPCDAMRIAALRQSLDFSTFVDGAIAASPHASTIYLGQGLVLFARDNGYDLIAAFHRADRRVDAYTTKTVDTKSLAMVEQLLDLKVDQITTDDPEGLWAALS